MEDTLTHCFAHSGNVLQAAYLLAVLAEHHCTHQLITTQPSIAALLHIMHTAGQTRTTSQTLDLDSARTAQQGRHSNGVPTTACPSDRGAWHMAGSPAAGMTHVSHAVSDGMSLRTDGAEEGEGATARPKSASSLSHSVDHSHCQNRVDGHDSSSDCEPNQAATGACDGSQDVSSSFASSGDEGGSMSEGRDRGGVEEAGSSSVHSRLQRAVRAARTALAGKTHAALLLLRRCCCWWGPIFSVDNTGTPLLLCICCMLLCLTCCMLHGSCMLACFVHAIS